MPNNLHLPPKALKKPYKRIFHNDCVVDNYEWMRNKEDRNLLNYLKAEKEYTKQKLISNKADEKRLYKEYKARVKEDDISLPVRSNGYWYWSRIAKGQNYPQTLRKKCADQNDWIPQKIKYGEKVDGEEIIFDADAEAKKSKELTGSSFFAIGSTDISEDSKFLLYLLDVQGDESYTLFIRNVETQQNLAETIDNVADASFDITGQYIYYIVNDEAWRPFQLYRHKIGDLDISKDELVYQEDDEEFRIGFGISENKNYLYLYVSSNNTSEQYYLSSSTPLGEFKCLWKRKYGVEYNFEIVKYNGQEYFFVHHNKDSINFSLDLYTFLGEYVARLIDSKDSDMVLGADLFERFLLFFIKKNTIAKTYLLTTDKFTDYLQNLDSNSNIIEYCEELLPKFSDNNVCEIYSLNAGASEFSSPVLHYEFCSYIHPVKKMIRDLRNCQETVLDEVEVNNRFDGKKFDYRDYSQKMIWIDSLPVCLVWNNTIYNDELPKNAPIVQNAYGAYGVFSSISFSASRLALLDRSIVFCFPYIRGGQELGRMWYEDGKKLNKKHSFEDFIKCSEYLISEGIADKQRIVACGSSAGGLLMGAVLNMAGHLYAGIEADVPFVDNLTTMLKPELPLTIGEWEEWGNPLEDKEVYDYIKSYSPYENIVEASKLPKVPQILVNAGFNDIRVLYVESVKWVAKLREYGYDPVLIMEMESGHGGKTGRYEVLKEFAKNDAWKLNVLKSTQLKY